MGCGGLMGKEYQNEAKQPEQQGQEGEEGRERSSPAANTFRRRSVRTYCPGRVATTTTTTTTTPTATATTATASTSSSSSPGISAATATVATEYKDEDKDDCDTIDVSELACLLFDFSAHVYKPIYRDIQLSVSNHHLHVSSLS